MTVLSNEIQTSCTIFESNTCHVIHAIYFSWSKTKQTTTKFMNSYIVLVQNISQMMNTSGTHLSYR